MQNQADQGGMIGTASVQCHIASMLLRPWSIYRLVNTDVAGMAIKPCLSFVTTAGHDKIGGVTSVFGAGTWSVSARTGEEGPRRHSVPLLDEHSCSFPTTASACVF
jgi:hypothetical protein